VAERRGTLLWLALATAAIASLAYIAFGGSATLPPPVTSASATAIASPAAPPTSARPVTAAPSASAIEAGACSAGAEPLEETYQEGTVGRGCARRVDGFVVREGTWTLVDREGRSMTGLYVDGKREGTWSAWYRSGVMFQRVELVHDKKNGWWIQWAEDGRKIFERHYKDDKLDGTSTEFFGDGSIERTQWRDGQRVD